jgi:hypothetical protein
MLADRVATQTECPRQQGMKRRDSRDTSLFYESLDNVKSLLRIVADSASCLGVVLVIS